MCSRIQTLISVCPDRVPVRSLQSLRRWAAGSEPGRRHRRRRRRCRASVGSSKRQKASRQRRRKMTQTTPSSLSSLTQMTGPSFKSTFLSFLLSVKESGSMQTQNSATDWFFPRPGKTQRPSFCDNCCVRSIGCHWSTNLEARIFAFFSHTAFRPCSCSHSLPTLHSITHAHEHALSLSLSLSKENYYSFWVVLKRRRRSW